LLSVCSAYVLHIPDKRQLVEVGRLTRRLTALTLSSGSRRGRHEVKQRKQGWNTGGPSGLNKYQIISKGQMRERQKKDVCKLRPGLAGEPVKLFTSVPNLTASREGRGPTFRKDVLFSCRLFHFSNSAGNFLHTCEPLTVALTVACSSDKSLVAKEHLEALIYDLKGIVATGQWRGRSYGLDSIPIRPILRVV
jgi:hypothetical protein